MDVHDIGGVLALHALGYSRVCLAPETDFAAAAAIARQSPVPVGVQLQGELCVARPGHCRLAEAMGESGDGACPKPCRRDLSLGGRMDSFPLSVRDRCLLENLDRLAEAGVAVGLLGRIDTPPEQLALGCAWPGTSSGTASARQPRTWTNWRALFPAMVSLRAVFSGRRIPRRASPPRPGRSRSGRCRNLSPSSKKAIRKGNCAGCRCALQPGSGRGSLRSLP